jgi:hypothetical protein
MRTVHPCTMQYQQAIFSDVFTLFKIYTFNCEHTHAGRRHTHTLCSIMGDTVQAVMDRMVPDLEDLQAKGLFTRDEASSNLRQHHSASSVCNIHTSACPFWTHMVALQRSLALSQALALLLYMCNAGEGHCSAQTRSRVPVPPPTGAQGGLSEVH